jgi:hypothetical protein
MSELPLAARRWDSRVYRPLWEAIRRRELSGMFPGDRTADMVARVAELHQQPGLDWDQALNTLARAGPATPTGEKQRAWLPAVDRAQPADRPPRWTLRT